MKSHKAIEKDKFLLSDEGKKLCSDSAHGQYLENRIIKAFLSGIDVGKHPQQPNAVDACSCSNGSLYKFFKKDE